MQASSLVNAFDYQTADKRIEVLRLIERTGSISKAAREAGISYKAAWQAIDTLSNLTGVTLVEKNVGGVGGGGAQLTLAGKRFLEIMTQLEIKRKAFFNDLLQKENATNDFPALGIQTSMRNQLPCRVQALNFTGPIVRVTLKLRDGIQLVARITRTSAELMALKPGLPVLALCKAAAVRIDRESSFSLSGSVNINTLKGTVSHVSKGEEEDELSIVTESGLQLIGFAPSLFQIKEQEPVMAFIDETTIVVALYP